MYSTLFTTTLFFALAALRVAAEFTVYTPELTQCQPATLNWDNTNGHYDVIIVPANDPCGDELADLGDIDTNTYQWSKVTIPAGTSVMVSVLDTDGQEGWSGAITVKPSDDNSCLTSQSTPSSTPTPTPTPQQPTHPSPSPSSSPSPTPTVVGAANNGLIGGGVSLRFNGVAALVTVLGALAALL
jgi:hypothetical protein